MPPFKIQPLGRLFGFDFHLGHVLLALVILVSWAIFYLQLQKPFVDLDDQPPSPIPSALASASR